MLTETNMSENGLPGVILNKHCTVFHVDRLFWNNVCCNISTASKTALSSAEGRSANVSGKYCVIASQNMRKAIVIRDAT